VPFPDPDGIISSFFGVATGIGRAWECSIGASVGLGAAARRTMLFVQQIAIRTWERVRRSHL
jgi:hypothetical protein